VTVPKRRARETAPKKIDKISSNLQIFIRFEIESNLAMYAQIDTHVWTVSGERQAIAF
jgi:hypothetical protein